MSYNRETLPSNDNVNPYAFSLEVAGEIFIRKGSMIAHYGELRFDSLGDGPHSTMVRKTFNAPAYAGQFSIVTGKGKLLVADYAREIASYDLEDGNLTIRAPNVLAFDKSLVCQECIMPGFLTLLGSGRIVASSNGPAHFMEPSVRVDEQAILGWADLPCPSYRYDYAAITNSLQMLGNLGGFTATGEEKQLDFTGKGTVLIQSSEKQVFASSAITRILSLLPGVNEADLLNLQSSIAQKLRR